MAYKRLLAYFDLIEGEIKRGNAGFVKWEQYDECHILSVFVSGPEEMGNKEARVYLDEAILGTLSIRGGRAEGTYLLTDKEQKEHIGRIKVVPDDNCVLIAEFETPHRMQVQERKPEEAKPVQEAEPEQEAEEPQEEPRTIWEQLGKSREPFYPFDNGVECFRIFPKDLNLLQPQCGLFRSNQFLMHGYYNYRHLIIFKKKDDAGEYWLGVPGIYHEREKMAARMFGFEKFEAKNAEYKTGDLGYYLVTVK